MTGFRKISTNNFPYKSPQEMYADYKNSRINGLYDHQSKTLESYMSDYYLEPNVAIQLPTGSGKTLIGLLIGEFRRRKNREKILYLCINNLLVNQTATLAAEYGISAEEFIGKKNDYSPSAKRAFETANSIAISSYSAFFNCNPFFQDADLIIFDDAHSAGEYISSNWTVAIERNNDLFFTLLETIRHDLPIDTYEKAMDGYRTASSKNWVDLIPNTRLYNDMDIVKQDIDHYLDVNSESPIRYAWSMIRDHLHACNIYVSFDQICIRPYIPPTLCFHPFAAAKQRIYMSATIGKSGELERSFGVSSIRQVPVVDGLNGRTTGRRLFLFPFASFTNDVTDSAVLKLINKDNRALLLVNSNKQIDGYRNLIQIHSDKKVLSALDLENNKDTFVNSDNSVAILANRTDGIDFPDNECRIELLLASPTETHIQERFFTRTICAQAIYSERIRSRLTQAFGRCTRSQTDYSVVCILSEDATDILLSPNTLQNLNPELQAEIVFGYENAKDQESLDDYLNLVDIFLHNRTEWKEFDNDILSERDRRINIEANYVDDVAAELARSSTYEVNGLYKMWNGNYGDAIDEIDSVLACMGRDELKGYYAYWCYVRAYCSYALYSATSNADDMSKCRQYLEEARNATVFTSWLSNSLDNDRHEFSHSLELDVIVDKIEQNIKNRLRKSNKKAVEDSLDQLLQDLCSSKGTRFEQYHCEIGTWMGYKCVNPKGDAEPDPIWILDENTCIVSEDKLYDSDLKAIPVNHVKQAAGHPNWVKGKTDDLELNPKVQCITVMITNSTSLSLNASLQGDNIYYLNVNDFLTWASKAVKVLKLAVDRFSGVGNPAWRNKLCHMLENDKVGSKHYIALVQKHKLRDLPEK